MSLINRHIKVVFGIFILLIISSCSTEKDAALNRGYHNMTSRYNGYFNARVLMDEALESYRASAAEDYTKILPLDLYPSKEEVPSIQEPYETAFEKCEKVIFRHSMPTSAGTKNKSVEHCRWIDDNWFVIGQINYTRHDYVAAVEIFKFVQESELYVDQERVHEARLWLAKTYIAMGNFPEAKRYLSQVEINKESAETAKEEKKERSKSQKAKDKKLAKKDKKNNVKRPAPFPKDLKDDYEIVMAEFYIAQKDYKKAIVHLEKGILLTKKRKVKARYMFVLAQLQHKLGNGDQASYYFNKVVHSNAPYVMRFQAQINKALSATSGGEELRKELTKMLKDAKNLEYKDQIYYALAEIEMKDGNVELAKSNYSASAFHSIKNDRQKGISYLKLANIHFDEKDYLNAQKYYDSCVQVLPEEYETYEQIKGKADGLSELVLHYETVVYEDSVQMVANMPEKEREKFLEKTLKTIKEEEAQRKAEEQQRLINQQNRVKNSGANSGSGSKWYFYNHKVNSSGFNDFRGLWGQRVLEDDWRRTNKTSYSSGDFDDLEDTESSDVEEDSLTVDVLRAALPLTPAAMDSSNDKLMNSMYMLGIIYKEQLKEEGEAISYFDKVVDKKIEHPRVLASLYQLYLIYNKKGSSNANKYKAQIITDYPDSEIAQIINDPDFLKKKIAREQAALTEYSETLEDYRYRRYDKVLTKCNQVISEDTSNQFINKYYLLKAFSIGKTSPGNQEAIRSPLEDLYALSPESEEGIQAKIYLDKLSKGIKIVDVDTVKAPESPYTFDDKIEHYFVLVFPTSAGKINQTQIKISNFNKEFYRSKRYNITTAQMGTENQVLMVRSFENLEEGTNYKNGFTSKSAKVTLGTTATDFEFFLINSANFTILFDSMDLKSYTDFYKENYP